MTDFIIDNSNPAGTDLKGVYSINSGQFSGFRNKIINGKMDIAQRGTTFAAIGTGVYSLDRWVTSYSTTGAVTISQQADAPTGGEFQNSLRAAVTTADASLSAGENFGIFQNIEGYNIKDLVGRTFTLSFWVRSSKTGIHCVSFRNTGVDRSYITEYIVNSANTWEKKSVTVTGGLTSAGTWNYTNGLGLSIGFNLVSGATFQEVFGSWRTGNFFATANQVNCLDTVGNIFAITGVQLEVGGVATAFEHRHIALEQSLCRWYTKKIQVNMVTSGFVQDYPFEEMRATPSATFLSPITFTGGSFLAANAFTGRQSSYSSVAGGGTCLLSAEL